MNKMSIVNKVKGYQRWANFEMCTKDFQPGNIEHLNSKYLYSYNVNTLGYKYIHDYMVYIILTKFLKFEYRYKPVEKVLYEIPFQYKEHFCMFTFEKSGFKFHIDTNKIDIIDQIFKKIQSASKIAEQLLSPIIDESINNGDVIIENKSSILRERYVYFRNIIKSMYKNKNIDSTISLNILPDFSTSRFDFKKDVFFNVQSMLEAYFSFQEHVLILLLPFTNIDFAEENISELINSNWSKIFNTVLSPKDSPNLMKHYENLRNIKELRNQFTHGGFEKKKGSILPYIEGVGTIPIYLSSGNEYSIVHLH